MKTILLIAALVLIAAAGAYSADWQWPAQMSVGGFQITNIRGSVNANGSGTATGTLQVPNLANASVSLTRSSRGEITGTASIDTRISGGSLRGNFALSNSGLRGRGSFECYSRSIESPDTTINGRGEVQGSGRMSVGRLAVQVDVAASGSSCKVSGEAPLRIQADTPVATYKFDGRVSVKTGGGLSAAISGKVERTGKLSNQVTSFNIPSTTVDLSNGQCTINVGGVSVTFSL